jgi:hypothetical protein
MYTATANGNQKIKRLQLNHSASNSQSTYTKLGLKISNVIQRLTEWLKRLELSLKVLHRTLSLAFIVFFSLVEMLTLVNWFAFH